MTDSNITRRTAILSVVGVSLFLLTRDRPPDVSTVCISHHGDGAEKVTPSAGSTPHFDPIPGPKKDGPPLHPYQMEWEPLPYSFRLLCSSGRTVEAVRKHRDHRKLGQIQLRDLGAIPHENRNWCMDQDLEWD